MIGDEPHSVTTNPSDKNIRAKEWIHLLCIAMILKDEESQNTLLEKLVLIKDDERFDTAWSQYMAALLGGNHSNRINLLEILKKEAGTDEGIFIGLNGNSRTIVKGRSELISRSVLPSIFLYEQVLLEKEEEFNKKLESYLSDKKLYIIQGKKEGFQDFWIDIPTIAVCTYAHQHKITTTIQSDYIPSWLYAEDWDDVEFVF